MAKQQKKQSRSDVAPKEPQKEQSPEISPANLERMFEQPEVRQYMMQMQMRSGPLPAPEELAQYDEVLPGLADRIATAADEERRHRHNMEHTALQGAINRDKRGQIFGLGAAIFFAGIAGLCILKGQAVAGSILGTVDVVGLVSVFVVGHLKGGASKSQDSGNDTGG